MLGCAIVRYAFYPFGEYVPLSVLRLAAPVCHLDPVEWLDSITTLPARFIGSDRVQALNEGGTANFIWHDATDINDLISRPQTRRVIWRDGTKI